MAALGDSISIPLKNKTGLPTGSFSIYVLGFSATSQKQLTLTAKSQVAAFTAITQENGTLPAYKLGEDITSISVNTQSPVDAINGARIYFFVSDNKAFPNPPVVTYTGYGSAIQNVPNPPNESVAPYTFAEFTLVDLSYGAVIDLQTVDGLVFPINLTLNDKLGSVGQPLETNAHFNREAMLGAYEPFITSVDSSDSPFLSLQYAGNSGGLLNPGLYLTAVGPTGNLLHLGSQLNELFDAASTELFNNNQLSLQGVGTGSITADIYTVKSTTAQPLPAPSTLSHPALQFVGRNTGTVLNVFSPVGLCTLAFDIDDHHGGGSAPITGQLNGTLLTFDQPLPADCNIQNGMFISGAGVDPASTTVTAISRNSDQQITSVTISAGSGIPAPSQYGFSKLPNMFMTSGAMVFANAGVFAYSGSYQGDASTIVLNLQNQLVCALNRGVANLGPSAGSAGYSSAYWGTETNWYPEKIPQNLFSLFMHTATVPVGNKNVPIFCQATPAAVCARGVAMGQAYGFAYDENPGPVPPAPSGQAAVPSKFDPLPFGANMLAITLGSWLAIN